jgi:TRAP-type mannitol/chloroaromatic compound transport system permease small subunit
MAADLRTAGAGEPRGDQALALEALARHLGRVAEATGALSAIAVLTLVAVMSGNVLLRYGFSAGSVWAQELEWHLMAPIALFGMVWALKRGEHVRVDVLYGRFSDRAKALADIASCVLGLVIAAAIVWLSMKYVGQSFANNEGSANPGGIPFRWALKALIPAGFVLLAIQYVAEICDAAARYLRA